MPKKKGLSAKQKRFAEVYDGNATDAARKAGYTGSDEVLATQGTRLLRNAEVAALIRRREQRQMTGHIASREERQRFWTQVMMDPENGVDMRDRLKASELLGKSNADFVERVEHSGQVSFAQLVKESFESSPAGPLPLNEGGGAGGPSSPASARSSSEAPGQAVATVATSGGDGSLAARPAAAEGASGALPFATNEATHGAVDRPDVPGSQAERPRDGEGEADR